MIFLFAYFIVLFISLLSFLEFSLFPYSYFLLLVLSFYYLSVSLLLSISPISLIFFTWRILKNSIPLLFTINVVSSIFRSIWPLVYSFSVHQSIMPFAIIKRFIFKCDSPFTLRYKILCWHFSLVLSSVFVLNHCLTLFIIFKTNKFYSWIVF